MHNKTVCLIFMVFLLVPAGLARAHAVQGDKLPFQTGRTDRNGCFAFTPHKPGTWQIVVKDGMGHRLSLNKEIDRVHTLAENTASPNQPDRGDKAGSLSRLEKALAGIAIIFGLSGLAFWWRGRVEHRQYRKDKNPGKEK